MARPINWIGEKKTKAIDIILDRIEDGEGVRNILNEHRDKDILPSRRVFNSWLRDDVELSTQYTHTCARRADILFDEIIDIADNSGNDKLFTEGGEVVNNEAIQRDRLRVEARKWAASKLNPKKYGDKLGLEHSGDMTINVTIADDD